MDLEEGRARDIMTVYRDGSGEVAYFDFPNTLLTLVSLVAYKLGSKEDRFDDDKKAELGRMYIEKFEGEARKLIARKDIADHIIFTDKRLGFLD